MNKRIITIVMMCVTMVALHGFRAQAQKSYPKDILVYQLENKVKYQGKAPKIGDFLTAYITQDETSEIMGSLSVAWNHYLRNEPQEPCCQFIVDDKNGYLRYTFDAKQCDDFEDMDAQTIVEMCYWNCADGKHKLIAENVISMMDGKYMIGQYSGTMFYIYDNATRQIWSVDDEWLGAYVKPVIDEANCQTTVKEMTVPDETIAVYSLPQQGKDINVVVYQGNKKTEARLVWDGMRFKQQ